MVAVGGCARFCASGLSYTCDVQGAGDSTQIAGITSFCKSDSTSRIWPCFWVTAVPPLRARKRWDSINVIQNSQRTTLQQYPRLTFRLNQQLLNKIVMLSRSRHRSRGQIIREAVEMYYRTHNPISRSDGSPAANFDTQLQYPNKSV